MDWFQTTKSQLSSYNVSSNDHLTDILAGYTYQKDEVSILQDSSAILNWIISDTLPALVFQQFNTLEFFAITSQVGEGAN